MGRINLTRIYTRLGDDGTTHLGDMSRVPKTDHRIEAFGTVDELNAQLGVALSEVADLPPSFRPVLTRIQNDLFDVGADLCLPSAGPSAKLSLESGQTRWLETMCDEINSALSPLTSFVLPGGTPAASILHVCRTICRRAERRALCVDSVNPEILRYLNRLSDLLFILSRAVNDEEELLWKPGESQAQTGDGD